MAFPDQIDRAAARDKPAIGFDGMHRDAILAMPAAERAAAILELVRARRCVLRVAGEHAGEILSMLGLVEDAEPETPVPARPIPMGAPTEKRCGRCKQTKPAAAFYPDPRYKNGLSSRCRDCHRNLNTEIQRRRRNRARVAREGAAR